MRQSVAEGINAHGAGRQDRGDPKRGKQARGARLRHGLEEEDFRLRGNDGRWLAWFRNMAEDRNVE
jgi:hypothetical protein